MRQFFIFLFIFCFAGISFAQKTLSGTVKNDDGKPIPSASVTLSEVDKTAIIAYGITNAKGEYKISFNSVEEKIVVKVKAFNRKPTSRTVNNVSQDLDFTLADDVTEIKEVQIKTKLITKRGDTISYDLKSFESKNDRVLADILKKLPGVEVNKDGTILYQGEAINKFYVNGKDLMEGGYGTINNSLPKDAIAKVEVMENHQPIKMLSDKVPSDKAAINIKLKKSTTMTGRAEIGAGLSPQLWNYKIAPMLFTEKYQWVLNYKANNNGERVEDEINVMAFGNRFVGIRRPSRQERWLSTVNASVPSLPEKRYLMNNVHLLSANVLTNLSKEWELKVNSSYVNNSINREGIRSTTYFPSTAYPNGLAYTERTENNFYTNQAKSQVIITKNAKKGFFKNTLGFDGYWNTDRGITDYKSGNSQLLTNENLYSPTLNFQNSMSAIIPWKEKMVNVMSFLNLRDDRQHLSIDPASSVKTLSSQINANTSLIDQYFRMKSFEARHSASLGFSYKNFTFTPEVGLDFETNKLTSDLNGIHTNGQTQNFGQDYENELDWKNTKPYTQLGINYKSENFTFNASVPFNFNHFNGVDATRGINRSLSKVTVEPSFFTNLDFANFWKWRTFGNISNRFGNINGLYGGYILFNSSSLNRRDTPIQETASYFGGTRIEYRNPLNNLFFNVSFNRSQNKTNLLINQIVNQYGQREFQAVEADNTTKMNMAGAEIGKYFPKAKSNISVAYNWNRNNSNQLFNNQFLNSESTGNSFTFKFNNAYFKWMSMDVSLSAGNSERNTSGNILKSNNYSHNINAFFYPFESHTLGMYWDYLASGISGKNYKNSFIDLSYQYTWVKKKIDFEFKWLNIANVNRFERISVDNLGIVENLINIRPSQFMFTVKFNFK